VKKKFPRDKNSNKSEEVRSERKHSFVAHNNKSIRRERFREKRERERRAFVVCSLEKGAGEENTTTRCSFLYI